MKGIEIVILIGAILISGFVGSYITNDMYQNEINSLTHRIDELNVELYKQKCPITIIEKPNCQEYLGFRNLTWENFPLLNNKCNITRKWDGEGYIFYLNDC